MWVGKYQAETTAFFCIPWRVAADHHAVTMPHTRSGLELLFLSVSNLNGCMCLSLTRQSCHLASTSLSSFQRCIGSVAYACTVRQMMATSTVHMVVHSYQLQRQIRLTVLSYTNNDTHQVPCERHALCCTGHIAFHNTQYCDVGINRV